MMRFFQYFNPSYSQLKHSSSLLGTKNCPVFAPSNLRSAIFLSMPPAYPVKLPFVPTTLWHGIIIEIGLCPTAPPTACADMVVLPVFLSLLSLWHLPYPQSISVRQTTVRLQHFLFMPLLSSPAVTHISSNNT